MFHKQLPDVSRNVESYTSKTSRAGSVDGTTVVQGAGSETGKVGTGVLATGVTGNGAGGGGGGKAEVDETVSSKSQPNTGMYMYILYICRYIQVFSLL